MYAIIIIGYLIGSFYYINMRNSIPYDSNCSFLANVWTDIFAFIGGMIIAYRGYYINNDKLLTTIGIAIIVEHLYQFSYKKNDIKY